MIGTFLSAAKFRLSDSHALFGGGVAEEDHDDAILTLHPGGQRRACGDRHGAADDRGGAGHADGLIDQVHRTAARSGASVDAAVHFAQHAP